MSDKPTFILIHESPLESWKRDTSTFALALACLVPGWAFGITSLTVLGALVFLCITAQSVLKLGAQPLSADEARAKINEIEEKFKKATT